MNPKVITVLDAQRLANQAIIDTAYNIANDLETLVNRASEPDGRVPALDILRALDAIREIAARLRGV